MKKRLWALHEVNPWYTSTFVYMEEFRSCASSHWLNVPFSQAQCDFFARLIEEMHLDSMAVSEAAYQLGMTHFRYAEYGLKPHFLDLWRQHLETVRFVRSLKAVDIRESQIVSESSRLLM